MKFPLYVEIYKNGKFLSVGKFVKDERSEYYMNFLTNIYIFSGHKENKKETGYMYGDGWANQGDISNSDFIKKINNKKYGGCSFKLKTNNIFKGIKI